MRITVLGKSPAWQDAGGACSGYLVEHEGTLRASVAMHPLGRIGEAEDVAALAAFLVSPDASWITGQVIAVDGGLSGVKLPPSI